MRKEMKLAVSTEPVRIFKRFCFPDIATAAGKMLLLPPKQ